MRSASATAAHDKAQRRGPSTLGWRKGAPWASTSTSAVCGPGTTRGAGDPLLLLHGGICTNETWGPQLPAFADRFRVVAPERRAHGHTADVDGPLTYADMAADTIGFLDAVVGGPAHVVGWSDGGIVGLLVAIERPDLVRKLVAIGTNYDTAGVVPEAEEMLET